MLRQGLLAAAIVLAPASALADDTPSIARKTFHTTAAREAIAKAACSIDPHVALASSTRPLDIHVEGRACVAAPSADAVAITIETVTRDGANEVILSTTLFDPAAADELRAVLDETALLVNMSIAERERKTPPPVTESPPPETPQKREWYGVATIGVDIAAAASCMTVVLCPLGLGLYVLGSPIVHWSHGQVGRGFASLGGRLAFSAVGIAIGIAAFPHGGDGVDYSPLVGFALGTIAGAVIMPIIDASIAYDEPQPPKATARVWPTVAPSKTGASVGLAGSF